MMKEIRGLLIAPQAKIAIIVAQFNGAITDNLLKGAIGALQQHGVKSDNVTTIYVPGAFEIPQVAMRIAKEGGFDGIICLGAVIRGATTHYDFVCNECAKGISHVGLTTGTPITFGVLTTENLEQAFERAGTKAGNKGSDVALACLEMISIYDQL